MPLLAFNNVSLPPFSLPKHPLSALPPPPLSLSHFRLPKSKPLPHTCSCSSPPQIFLPHLNSPPQQRQQQNKDENQEDDNQEDEQGSDPMLDFFKHRSSLQEPNTDPDHHGRVTLHRSLHASWRLADFGSEDDEDGRGQEGLSGPFLGSAPEVEAGGVVGEILAVALSLPENATLGELLGPFVGRVGEGECIELLGLMGREGLVRECLYLFEWMGLQEPSLVTPRACSVLFPVLGGAGMGDKLMVLFENLPRGRRFRDVCVYNSAISGLAACGR